MALSTSKRLGQATLEPCRFGQLTGWEDDDHSAAYEAFLRSAGKMVEKPYRSVSTYFEADQLISCAKKALKAGRLDAMASRDFFEAHFTPNRIVPKNGASGFMTGFYEPVVEASSAETHEFKYPLYKRPAELIDVNDANRPASMDVSFRYGCMKDGVVAPYFTRSEIQNGVLEGRELELVWLKDKTDVFFIHVQGSARLDMTDGSTRRLTYAAKSGHPYTSVAKILCAQTGISAEEMTSDKLADWMRSNPAKIDDLLAHNQSYIFFKEVDDLTTEEGPVAAAKVPLTAGRSMAVDRELHTFGLPFWINTKKPLPNQQVGLARLWIAQDTGSAIVGAARGDLFMGSGQQPGLVAGRIRHDADLTVLVPTP